MRLSELELKEIQSSFLNWCAQFNFKPTLYLFGSRCIAEAKGGDIDLLVITQDANEKKVAMAKKLDLVVDIKFRIGDQKIDVSVIEESQLNTDPFWQTITNKIQLA